MHRIRYVAAAATLVGGLSACSVYTDMTTSDFAKQDADAIVSAASEAMQGVTSMRVTGQVRSKGNQVFVDLRMDRDDMCTGSMRLGGSNIDIRRVKDKAWIKGESGAFNRLSRTPLPAAALKKLSSSWIPIDDRDVVDLCDLDSILEGFEVVDYGDDPGDSDRGKASGKDTGKGAGKKKDQDRTDDPVPATVGEESSIDGQKVVQLSGTPGGQHEELVWVLSEAPHYVVRLESTAAREGGELALTEFDQDVTVEAPDPADVFRP
jgi:hypothetical protein